MEGNSCGIICDAISAFFWISSQEIRVKISCYSWYRSEVPHVDRSFFFNWTWILCHVTFMATNCDSVIT